MPVNSNAGAKHRAETPGFLHRLCTHGLLAFFLCMILPFLATLAGEGLRLDGLYHRDLDNANLIVGFANSMGLWPLFWVLLMAAFPAVTLFWVIRKHRRCFASFAEIKYYSGLALACGYSVVFWVFWTPWSNPNNLEDIFWALAMAVVYPGLNGIVIGILVIFYYAADEEAAQAAPTGSARFSRVASTRHEVWVFGRNSRPIGIWVPFSRLTGGNLENYLKMAVAMQVNEIKRAGGNPDAAGFNVDLFAAFAEQRYRAVAVKRLEVANRVRFESGAFLMLGDARAPSEASNPIAEWEVRNHGGYANLVPIRKSRK